MLVACVSLAVALSGTGYAVSKLPPNSVGTAQLKKNAVTSAKVRNRTLLAADFAKGQLLAGARGPSGPQGPEGPPGQAGSQGPAGANGATTVTVRVGAVKSTTTSAAATAACAANEVATGGGFTLGPFPPVNVAIGYSAPYPAADGAAGVKGWQVGFRSANGGAVTGRAYVMCASP